MLETIEVNISFPLENETRSGPTTVNPSKHQRILLKSAGDVFVSNCLFWHSSTYDWLNLEIGNIYQNSNSISGDVILFAPSQSSFYSKINKERNWFPNKTFYSSRFSAAVSWIRAEGRWRRVYSVSVYYFESETLCQCCVE